MSLWSELCHWTLFLLFCLLFIKAKVLFWFLSISRNRYQWSPFVKVELTWTFEKQGTSALGLTLWLYDGFSMTNSPWKAVDESTCLLHLDQRFSAWRQIRNTLAALWTRDAQRHPRPIKSEFLDVEPRPVNFSRLQGTSTCGQSWNYGPASYVTENQSVSEKNDSIHRLIDY